MNEKVIFTYKALRAIYDRSIGSKLPLPIYENDIENASQIIRDALTSDSPCMISRLGATELNCLTNYLGVKSKNKNRLAYIQGVGLPWWWNQNIIRQMEQWSGFFPSDLRSIDKFCEMMLQDIQLIDVLGSWLKEEYFVEGQIKKTEKVKLPLLEPYISTNPWSSCLEGKKVLVIHPFARLIENQYARRSQLFQNQQVLPDFQLATIPAVQSLGGEDNGFKSWFDALNFMKDKMDSINYDYCLIGAGAYGLPLAAHAKRSNKKAIHLGGALQLLFGIKGSRWEDPNYAQKWGLPKNTYLDLMNDNWVRPSDDLRPKNADSVEGACYW